MKSHEINLSPVCPDGWVGQVPRPPPPPRQRVKGLCHGKALEKGLCKGKSMEKGLCQGKGQEKSCKGQDKGSGGCGGGGGGGGGGKMRTSGNPGFTCSREAEDLIV